MKDIDVLNLEWPNSDRDVHATAPVINELRGRGFICVTGDIFSYLYYLMKYRPKVLLISNYQGATINHQLCSLANYLKIKVITLIAEGNIREAIIEQMTWGHNKEKKIHFEKMLLWSYRSESLMHQYFPQLLDKTSVVGGVGFDRYKRLKFLSKSKFIDKIKHTHNYKKVIGLAGWGFDRVHDTEFYFKNEKSILANFNEGQKQLHQNDFILIQEYMLEVAKNNPDILFILRPHPGLTDYYYDEFKELKHLSNVYYSKPRVCPYSTSDLISVSDLWGGYETTTCLEAWLMNKETFLLNPSGPEFNRDITAKGSYIISELKLYDEVVKSECKIATLFENTEVIINERNKIISDVIGFDDGQNYLRAVEKIEPILLSIQTNPRYNIFSILRKLKFFYIFKNCIRNINFLNKLRGLRLTDQSQIERYITLYENKSILIKK